jgi:hypothetical protein
MLKLKSTIRTFSSFFANVGIKINSKDLKYFVENIDNKDFFEFFANVGIKINSKDLKYFFSQMLTSTSATRLQKLVFRKCWQSWQSWRQQGIKNTFLEALRSGHRSCPRKIRSGIRISSSWWVKIFIFENAPWAPWTLAWTVLELQVTNIPMYIQNTYLPMYLRICTYLPTYVHKKAEKDEYSKWLVNGTSTQ